MILWDVRSKASQLVEKFKYQITSLCFNSTSDQIFIGGIDNLIKVYDLRKKQVIHSFVGHTDTITGLALSNDGNLLLSNSADCTLRCWDVAPYSQGKCVKVFNGATHNFEKNLLRCAWSSDDTLVSAGSADRFVYIWNYSTTKIERKLGGHLGTINETSFNKLSNVIASCSSDKVAIIGEY
jgi:Prp8 binding protein